MNKNFIAFFIFCAFWLSLLTFTGTLTSGYHFTDDHEIIRIKKELKEQGFINTVQSWVKGDLNIRFRPFYFIHRVILTKIFGTNFLAWSMHHAILAILTSYALFLFIYKQGYNFIHALIFPFLTLVGAQSAVWWRLGPNETIGFFLLSMSLFLLVNALSQKRTYQLISSLILLFLASLSKESFVLFIPAYILLMIYYYHKTASHLSIFEILKKKTIWFVILILATLFLVEIYVIVSVVGTNKIGYAGIDNSFSVMGLIKFICQETYSNKNIYVIIILSGVLLLTMYKYSKKDDLNIRKKYDYLYHVAILFVIIMPQFVLYCKSGMFERYLLPFNLGYSFFIIFLLQKIYIHTRIKKLLKKVLMITIIGIIMINFKNFTLRFANIFAKEGVTTHKFISSIIHNTNANDSALIVLNGAENAEWVYALDTYLTIEINKKNVYFYHISNPTLEGFMKNLEDIFLQGEYKKRTLKDINNSFACIAILPFNINKAVKDRLDSNTLYRRIDFDNFTTYAKKDYKKI